MKIVVADTGAIISLVHIGEIDLIEKVFGDFYLSKEVWNELNNYDNPDFDQAILRDLEKRVGEISTKNYLSIIMDLAES
jgi:predicted nucleic acid-binding protein